MSPPARSRSAPPLTPALTVFGRAVRAAGVPAGTDRMIAFGRAARVLGPDTLDDLYWAGRLTLPSSPEEVERYDRVFAAFFGDAVPAWIRPEAPALVRVEREEGGSGGSLDPGGAAEETAAPATGLLLAAASPSELLRRRSFEAYTPEEHARARLVIERLAARRPRRRSRRTRTDRRRGTRPDLARMLRRSLRTGGEPFERAWLRRRTRPRRLVMLLDVSGSMAPFARPLAQLAHALVLAGRDVEVFTFGTQLTRLTPALRSRDRDAVLAAIGRTVPDWRGGTRIGEALEALVHGWGRRGPLRGAVVVIVSDGLDRGEPELVAREMERLGRLAHRVVWVNPLAGSPEYRPLARGMAAALPHVDVFLPGHNLESLERLADVLVDAGA